MAKLSPLICAAVLFVFPLASNAEQSQDFANLKVHYMALPSTSLPADIGKRYGIKRSKYSAVITITVQDKQADLAAISAQLSGTATNLIGQTQILNFQEFKEGKAIYYLATYPFINEEIVNFKIKIDSQNRSNILKFQQQLYVDLKR